MSHTDSEILLKPPDKISILRSKISDVFSDLTKTRDLLLSYSKTKVTLGRLKYEYACKLREEYKSIMSDVLVTNPLVGEKNRIDRDRALKSFNDVFESIEVYFSEMSDQQDKTNQVMQSQTQSHAVTHSIKLPNINIPPFSNNMKDFAAFDKLFTAVYKNNNVLSGVEKFYYLMSLLSGESLSLVQQYPLSEEGFVEAYESLKKRFLSPRTLATIYVKELLNFEPLKKATAENLKNYLEVHQNQITALRTLPEITDLSDFLLLQLCSKNLDSLTRRLFEQQVTKKVPSYRDLIEFVVKQCQTQSLIETEKPEPVSKMSNYPKKVSLAVNMNQTIKASGHKKSKSNHEIVPTRNIAVIKCNYCNNVGHKIYRCPEYAQLSFDQRIDWVNSNKRCHGCLGSFHVISNCKSSHSCGVCQSRLHHTSLHEHVDIDSDKPKPSLSCHLNEKVKVSVPNMTVLPTLVALVFDKLGYAHSVRCVLDSGSMTSLITHDCVKRLGLSVNKFQTVCLSGVGETKSKTMGSVQFFLNSRFDSNLRTQVEANVLKNITSDLPASQIPKNVLDEFSNISLADPNFGNPAKIDVLLSVDAMMEILNTKLSNHSSVSYHTKIGMDTGYGFIVCGKMLVKADSAESTPVLFIKPEKIELNEDLIKQFWECEKIPDTNPESTLSFEEQYAVDHFMNSYKRNETGKFFVSLPFKPNAKELTLNRTKVLSIFNALERRLSKDPKLSADYNKAMTDYLDLDQIKIADTVSDYLVTHHGVYKSPNSPIRIVFNASFPSGTPYVSLNSELLPGPALQRDLTQVLTGFRLPLIGMTCDISQMFRNINLNPDSSDLIHFVSRIGNGPPKEWSITHLCFGLTCSPFIALKAIEILCEESRDRYPDSSRLLSQQRYCDDICFGADSVPELIRLRDEIILILKSGGFPLRKFVSSNASCINDLSAELCSTINQVSDLPDCLNNKVLGLYWEPCEDVFTFKVDCFSGIPTKRSCLSFIMKTYDPCGLVNPFVFSLKLFMQRLWLENITDWDAALNSNLTSDWFKLVNDISLLKNLQIKRPFRTPFADHFVVAFCDASDKGWGAALYIVNKFNSETRSSLIIAKSKLAPIKSKLTIPKQELNAILMGAKLINWFKSANFPIVVKQYCLFSDSQIALAWLKTPIHKLKVFCANRVSQILQITPDCVFLYVRSEENPADLVSRGTDVMTLINNDLWFHGPKLLSGQFTHDDCNLMSAPDPLPELKTNCLTVSEPEPLILLTKYSNWSKLVKITALCLRFSYNVKNPKSKKIGPILASEKTDAINSLIKHQQKVCFPEDLYRLTRGKEATAYLKSLSPFLHEGIVLAGGRSTNAPVSFFVKHPVILPANAAIVPLLCRHYHEVTGHSGPSFSFSLLREKFFIIRGRPIMRKVVKECVKCARWHPRKIQPIMGDLPLTRITPSRPFSTCGMDYAGFFNVKTGPRRNSPIAKGYLLVIVCFSTKACHLEFVSDLTTNTFFAAFDRFVSRRGIPNLIMSDQGRTFLGASNQFKLIHEKIMSNKDSVLTYFSDKGIEWKFIPPYSPERGGLWEAAVKSAKKILHKIVGDKTLSFEEFTTVFARVESLLNSRPLFPINPDNDTVYLTAGHFLIGGPLVSAPEAIVDEGNLSLRCRWTRVRDIVQQFWRIWSSETINYNMQRRKWQKATDSLKIGQVVLIPDMKCSPSTWPLGVIVKVNQGSKEAVRSVEIRISNGEIIWRSANKLVLVPLVDEH